MSQEQDAIPQGSTSLPIHDSSDSLPRTVDVLIIGGGPTGLIVLYILLRARLDVLAVEQHDKEQAMYGRACMLYARSSEILDQLGLFDEIAEIGYITRDTVTYKGLEEFTSRGWSFVAKAMKGKTYLDFSFSIRQKMLEEVLRKAIKELNPGALRASTKLVDFTIDSSKDYPVLAKIEVNGAVRQFRSKYLIGADGGRSTVRTLAQIPFPGSASPFRWVRLDAIVRTDIPAGRRGSVAIESPTHGNVLWTPTDNGRTRIGFICTPAFYGENGEGITAQAIISETKEAIKPFTIEFVQLDWWTVYSIGQHVAEQFREGPVILAGDAAHTHSSGAAQGMNTGIHDASNLAWKLAGVLKGWYTEEVLDTYATERRASAQRLIQLDKDISSLISGVIPAHFNASPDADAHMYLDEVFQASAAFTVGLGVSYAENLINQGNAPGQCAATEIKVGHRAPDSLLHRPGARFPKRLQEFTPNHGRFWILVFAGGLDPGSEQPRLRRDGMNRLAALRTYVQSPASFVNTLASAFEFLTIVRGERILQTAEMLGGEPLGRAVYDLSGEAYTRYGVDGSAGAVVVLRPDGIVAFIATMDQLSAVEQYFTAFVLPVKEQGIIKGHGVELSATCVTGEISLEGKEEETIASSLGL